MKRLRRFALWTLLVFAVGWLLLPGCELYPEGVTWSRVALDREGKVLHLTLAADGRYRLRTALAEIDAEVVEATLRHEDRWFRWHPGVNPVSLMRGLAGLVGGGKLGGGSTQCTDSFKRGLCGCDPRLFASDPSRMARCLELAGGGVSAAISDLSPRPKVRYPVVGRRGRMVAVSHTPSDTQIAIQLSPP